MSWSKDFPLRHSQLIEWINLHKDVDGAFPLWLKTFSFSPAWVLLGVALYQKISWKSLILLLESLRVDLGDDIFSLPEPTLAYLQKKAFSIPELEHWLLLDVFPGIIWDVGNFVRKYPDLDTWNASEVQSIHYMGKNSVFPWKVNALWFWLDQMKYKVPKYTILPPRAGIEYMNRFGPKVWKSFTNFEEKCFYFDRFCCFVMPDDPKAVAHALHFYEGYEEEQGFTKSV